MRRPPLIIVSAAGKSRRAVGAALGAILVVAIGVGPLGSRVLRPAAAALSSGAPDSQSARTASGGDRTGGRLGGELRSQCPYLSFVVFRRVVYAARCDRLYRLDAVRRRAAAIADLPVSAVALRVWKGRFVLVGRDAGGASSVAVSGPGSPTAWRQIPLGLPGESLFAAVVFGDQLIVPCLFWCGAEFPVTNRSVDLQSGRVSVDDDLVRGGDVTITDADMRPGELVFMGIPASEEGAPSRLLRRDDRGWHEGPFVTPLAASRLTMITYSTVGLRRGRIAAITMTDAGRRSYAVAEPGARYLRAVGPVPRAASLDPPGDGFAFAGWRDDLLVEAMFDGGRLRIREARVPIGGRARLRWRVRTRLRASGGEVRLVQLLGNRVVAWTTSGDVFLRDQHGRWSRVHGVG